MIRFKCPTCAKQLRVDDSKAGAVATCPGCSNKLRIPRPSAADTSTPETEPEEERVAAGRKKPAPAPDPEDEPDAPPEAGDEESPEEEEHGSDEGDDDRPRERRRRRRKKKRRARAGFEYWLNPLLMVLVGLVVVWVVFGALSLVLPAAGVVLIGAGILAAIGGQVWLWMMASEDREHLALFLGWYMTVYILSNLDRTWRPVFVQALGVAMAVSGFILFERGGGGGEWDNGIPRRPAQASRFYQQLDLDAVVKKAAASEKQLTWNQQNATKTDTAEFTGNFTCPAGAAQRFLQRLRTDLRDAARATGAETVEANPEAQSFEIVYTLGNLEGFIAIHLEGNDRTGYRLTIAVEEFEE